MEENRSVHKRIGMNVYLFDILVFEFNIFAILAENISPDKRLAMSDNEKDLKEKIQKLVLSALQLDKDLREKFQVGDKFRFIRDRLNALALRVQDELKLHQESTEKKSEKLEEDEILVYVHLFNAQGLVFQTWQKMIGRSVFYEYSVNRPIYLERAHIEAFIRSKANKAQHGFLTVALKKEYLLATPEQAKDIVGHPLVKIREGSLDIRKMFSFTHQECEYVVNDAGQLIKK